MYAPILIPSSPVANFFSKDAQVLIGTNQLRLEYYGIVERDSLSFSDTEWLTAPPQLRIAARDNNNMFVAFVIMCMFFSLSCVRSKFSWVVMANTAFVSFIMKFFMTPGLDTNPAVADAFIWCLIVTIAFCLT